MRFFFFKAIIFCFLLTACIGPASARWFLLPGVYYSDEYGVIGQIALITESRSGDRTKTGLHYFGGEEGQIFTSVFVPRPTREWTLEARYQINEVDAYSSQYSSNHSGLVSDLRYWTEAMVRCDFIRKRGFFWGVQTSFKNFQYKSHYHGDTAYLTDPEIAAVYTEGQEYSGGFRIGWERRDNRYDSRSGFYLLGTFDLGYTRAGNDTEPLTRAEIDLRKYFALGSRNSVLALNLRSGWTRRNVPYFSRFTLGGSQSMRGVPLDRYTGSRFYLLRAEFRQIVINNVPTPLRWLKFLDPGLRDHKFSCGFVLFTDAGDMWRTREGWWGLQQNVGVGLRAVFPPNVVASIDVASPLDSDYIALYLDLAQSF